MFKIKCFNAMSILSIMQTLDVRFRFCIQCGNPDLITLLSEPIIQF